jgi:hypothetical protein
VVGALTAFVLLLSLGGIGYALWLDLTEDNPETLEPGE